MDQEYKIAPKLVGFLIKNDLLDAFIEGVENGIRTDPAFFERNNPNRTINSIVTAFEWLKSNSYHLDWSKQHKNFRRDIWRT